MMKFILFLFCTLSVFAQQADNRIVEGNIFPGIDVKQNLVKNPMAEKNVLNFSSYADAPATSPVDGNGGSPTTTCTRSTSSPIDGSGSFILTKDAANRQGEGCSWAVSSVKSARVYKLEFDVLVGSGTFVAGTSSADSDTTFWIYDTANGTLIQPSTIKIFSNSTTIVYRHSAYFQTPTSSAGLRVIAHVGSTSASAYTLKIDNLSVSEARYIYGSPITDWVSFTPTGTWLGGAGNTTYTGYWRRVGDSMEVNVKVLTGGAPTSATLTVNIPTGYTIDTSKLAAGSTTAQKSGDCFIQDAGTTNYQCYILYNNTTSMALYAGDVSTYQRISTAVTQLVPMTWANGDSLVLKTAFPVLGWSSSVQMSDNADVRDLSAYSTLTSATHTSTGNWQNLPSTTWTTTKDTHSGFSAAGVYTVSVSGSYIITGQISWAGNATGIRSCRLVAGGTTYPAAGGTAGYTGDDNFCNFNYLVSLNAGNTIQMQGFQNSGGNLAYGTTSFININRNSGPSAIAASESVNARYFASATSMSGSLATIVWTTKDYDTHGAMSSGIYTCPIAGKYAVNAFLALSGTFVLNTTTVMEIQVNGSAKSNITHYIAAAITNEEVDIEDIVSCNAGDTIKIQASNSGTLPVIVTSNTRNYISINRVGYF